MIELTPSTLDEVIWVTPGICANCVSSGVVTDDAMVTGSAPGRLPGPRKQRDVSIYLTGLGVVQAFNTVTVKAIV